MPSHGAAVTPLLLLMLAAAGCRNGAEQDAPADFDQGRFGDPYEIVLGEHPADPDQPPAITSDTLVALVTYPGGCEDHAFALGHSAARDTARLWIQHDAHGDDCEGLLHDRVALPVPAEALQASTVLLLHPQDEPPYVLRWGLARDAAPAPPAE